MSTETPQVGANAPGLAMPEQEALVEAPWLERRRIAVAQRPLKQWNIIPDALVQEFCTFINGRIGSKPDLLLDLYETFSEPYWLSKSSVKELLEKAGEQDLSTKEWKLKADYRTFLTGNKDGLKAKDAPAPAPTERAHKRARSMSFDADIIQSDDEFQEVT